MSLLHGNESMLLLKSKLEKVKYGKQNVGFEPGCVMITAKPMGFAISLGKISNYILGIENRKNSILGF